MLGCVLRHRDTHRSNLCFDNNVINENEERSMLHTVKYSFIQIGASVLLTMLHSP